MVSKKGNWNNLIRRFGFDKRPELKKLTGYITRTKSDAGIRTIYSDELATLYQLGKKDIVDAVVLSFFFGQAKGVRAATRKEGSNAERNPDFQKS